MELYTSLTRLKMEMNGGRLPDMTPLSETAKRYLDPKFTGGMGSLDEHPTDGRIRCPVRSCGKFFHNLAWHLDFTHKGIGGKKAVMAVLGLPDTVRLASRSFRENKAAHCRRRMAEGSMRGGREGRLTLMAVNVSRAKISRRGKKYAETHHSIMALNLRNRCESQLASGILDLAQEIGASPSWHAAETKFGKRWLREVIAVYGSWNNLKTHVGLRVQNRRWTREEVVESVGEFYRVNGRLPTAAEGLNPQRTPLIPSTNAIIAAMHAETWNAALEGIAFELGIEFTGRRPGMRLAGAPERHRVQSAAVALAQS